ncbi:XrtB/PEP-CTERM-associated polysaccharide biosynthesis outer membrane protein EpsL [Duganella aquatilis]|nr:XrtB/PEP-CTERM-associated polysaccharide biosynthesis outer membrane protein EpsL [Duganella aquatilis]
MLAPPAQADISDTIKPFVLLGYTHDDNLLRLEDGQQLEGSRADNIRQAQAGFSFERPVGRQVFTGSAKVSKVSFDHFSQLDYTGLDYEGTWQWALGNHLNGHLGATYSQTIAPFADFHTNERNLKKQKHNFGDIFWRFHPSWQAHAGYVSDEFDYDLASQRFNNRTEKATDAGIDFLAGTGSRIGVVARRLKGHYPYGLQQGAVLQESDYTQDELKLSVLWRVSDVTQLQFLGGRVERKHDLVAQRDASGTNARLTAQWSPRARLRFSAAAWREFTAVESSVLNYALGKGGSVTADWDLTSKITLNARARREKRDFNGVLASVLPISYNDDTRGLGAGVTYAPTRNSQLNAQYNRDTRDPSNRLFSSGYHANSVSFNASIQF